MNALSRRTWLRSSFLALGGAAALLAQTRRTARAAAGAPRRLFVVFVRGGWDTTCAIDPKPGLAGVDAPAGTVQSFGGLDVVTIRRARGPARSSTRGAAAARSSGRSPSARSPTPTARAGS